MGAEMSMLLGLVYGMATQTLWLRLCERRGWCSVAAMIAGIPLAVVSYVLLYAAFLWVRS